MLVFFYFFSFVCLLYSVYDFIINKCRALSGMALGPTQRPMPAVMKEALAPLWNLKHEHETLSKIQCPIYRSLGIVESTELRSAMLDILVDCGVTLGIFQRRWAQKLKHWLYYM